MSAFAVAHTPGRPADAAAVRRMLEAAPHRGALVATAAFGGTAVGAVGRAPDGTATVAGGPDGVAVLAGRLDNETELREQLARAGAPVTGTGSAAVLLAAHRRWGERALGRLRGAFAGAVSDGRRLWCVRDQFGLRPLHYRDAPGAFAAASEAKQVVAGAGIAWQPDLDAVERAFYGEVDEASALKGVLRLPRAAVLQVDERGHAGAPRRYWDPRGLLETARMGPEEAREGLRAHLRQAVERCLTGQDAVLLSGGMDSPSLAALAAPAHLRRFGVPLQAVSAVYPEHASVDERAFIRPVVDRLGLPWRTFVPHAARLDEAQHWAWLADGPPLTLSLPQCAETYGHVVATGARSALVGDVEEYLLEVRHYLVDHLLWQGRWGALAEQVRLMRAVGRSRRAVARRLVAPLVPPRLAAAYVRARREPRQGVPPWVDADRLDGLGAYADLAQPPRERWAALQSAPLFGHVAAFEADEVCAAASGVDVRRPFADVDLWEFALSLSGEVKFPSAVPKGLLRETMRGLLPDEVVDRRDKTYFDEYSRSTVDYAGLRSWLSAPPVRLGGVDYALLRRRLDQEAMPDLELRWAHDLAYAHAFLALWETP